MSETLKWGGPFRGFVSAVAPNKAPANAIVGTSTNVVLNPFDGSLVRRYGQTIQGDSLSGGIEATGLLETKFSSKGRHMAELYSDSATDGLPMPSCLVSTEGNAAPGAYPDTGWFGAHYHRDITAAVNYTLAMEFSSTHYPSAGGLGSNQLDFKVVPMWCESGDGLYNRGTFNFARSLLFGGSRKFVDAGNWRYFGNLHGTPSRWNRRYNTSTASGTEPLRLYPTGPWGPMLAPSVVAGTASTGSDAAWTAGDYFYVSVIFQFEDGSYSLPFLPRAANARLASGLGAITVGTIASGTKYRNVTWSNIPIGPSGTVARILLRSPKQNLAAATDVLTVSPGDLRITGVLRNNTQTSYTDTQGADAGLLSDTNIVRFDHILPRRMRYLWTGDQRMIGGYSLPNPAAIMIAPTTKNGGTSRQYNVEDTNLAGFLGAFSMLARVTTSQLELHYIAGASGPPNSTNFAFATYTTLQDLVDAINNTSNASTGGEWVAALAPGVDGSLPSTYLCPTTRDVTSVKCTNGSPTLTNGDFSLVPVGAKISDGTANFAAGTYVLSKQSPSSITMSANATATDAAGHTATFYSDVGDEANVTGGTHGYLRAFCPALPVVLYLATQYQQGYATPDKQSIYFTVSSPGAASSGVSLAANAFVAGNRRTVSSRYGILMGGVDLEQSAVVAYSKSIQLFVNQRGVISGEDFDYRMVPINDKRGCIAYGTLVSGNGWASYLTPQGVVATDKTRREVVLSNDIHNPSTLAGSLNYEIGQCLKGTRADSDLAYAHAQVFGAQLHLVYRDAGNSRPNKRVIYDFGPGIEGSGLAELVGADGDAGYGWSAPLTNPPTVMCEVGRSNGLERYGWRDTNAGSLYDGRLQLFDDSGSSAQDDGSAILASAYSPTVVAPHFQILNAKRLSVIHKAASIAPLLYVGRDKNGTTLQSSTLSTDGVADYIRDLCELKLVTRANAEALQMRWTSGAEDGQTLWEAALEYERSEALKATVA